MASGTCVSYAVCSEEGSSFQIFTCVCPMAEQKPCD